MTDTRPLARAAQAAAVAALLLAQAAASAQSFRCRSDQLAKVGDSKSSVLSKCGSPALQDSFCKKPPEGSTGNTPCETVDEWTYNPGSGQLMTTLRFESGELKSIRYGERVP